VLEKSPALKMIFLIKYKIEEELKMNKFLSAICASVFLLGSSAVLASGNLESALTPVSAQDILNKMACEGKKAGDKIKDRIDGEMVTCPAKIKNPRKGGAAAGSAY
jgi:hypothetical protein